MPGGEAGHGLGGDHWRLRHQGADQAAAAEGGQVQALLEIVIRHQRADRAEGLDLLCTFCVAPAGLGQSSRVGAKKAPFSVPAPSPREVRPVPDSRISLPSRQLGDLVCITSACCAWLASAPMRTPSSTGSPTTILRQARLQGGGRPHRSGGAGTMARRMAVHFWPALARHFARHLLDEELELGVGPVRTSGRQHGAVQAVRLGVEGDRAAQHIGVGACSCIAVSALPVKVTTSGSSRRSNRSPVPPTMSCRQPAQAAGRSPSITRTAFSAT
jgi:hypothetical protein